MAKKFLVDLRLKARLKAWICQISTNSSADDAPLTTDSILASTALPQDERFCVHDFNWLRVNDLTRKLLIVGVETLPENIIACILLEDLDGFMQMEEVTQFFGTIVSRRNSYSPTYLEVCMARTNSGWCRVVYLGYAYGNNNLILDSCKVYCIDYGIVCIIPQIDIREMGLFAAHNVLTMNCHVHGMSYEEKIAAFKNQETITGLLNFDEERQIQTLEIVSL